MKNIDLLTALTQQISAVMDDMELDGCKVLSVNVGCHGEIEIHLKEKSFFNSFHTFNIKRGMYDSGFFASKIIQGVKFIALTDDPRIWLRANKFTLKKGHKKSLRALECG